MSRVMPPGGEPGRPRRAGSRTRNDEVFVSLVHGLQRRARAHVDDAAHRHNVPLGGLAEVHREAAGDNNEGLLLIRMDVTKRPLAPGP
jgi:hypothetical protein